jgi:enediyne biosynthesis protein E4
VPVPTRGIATGDPNGDGLVDFAVARQFDAPVFYQNQAPDAGEFLGLRLTQDGTQTPGAMPAPGSPATGAEVTVTTKDGRKFIERVDGGSGHSGKRSHEVHIGLGKDVDGPVKVCVKWRDRGGDTHMKEFVTSTGWHDYKLGTELKKG